MEKDTEQKLAVMEEKLNRIYTSVEKTRKYFLWTIIAGVLTFLLPLIGLAFALPAYLKTLNLSSYGL